MFEEFHICPYTGLRSFTEEESLYFKGREENIEQAIEQLQRNKFLMLTGASGDGKSSLVYAGIIPNARAGFLKSRYTLWSVADFRPERNPFKNLCQAVAEQLDISNVHTVESELRHGFSALVELYRNSKRFMDTDSQDWQQADEAGKKKILREAGNLMILVDQFEEFFTNPENYHNGAPSTEANLVLNLLLETARIAYEEDLPIYVVFTMRSDFIGQCAAFRGLPEYIGFSQFFVPRLNRTQLQQVIEEPAVLSGNRITRRLTERLIHDLTEGVDQLPILQHALNQIWHAAGHGSEEMDLIHYAMVGGMPVEELPDDQMDRCRKWFAELPAEIRECYHEPGLQNVLDTHTNKLYQEAAAYYREKTGQTVSDEDVSQVIKTAFTCLTKIDQSRAVRNRMTLQEITDILNRPGMDVKKVGIILNIFREPGNTFIRPFIPEGSEGDELDAGDVLDITHESLIRNWKFLDEWATEEYDNYTIFLDFEKQMDRWLESGKSKGYLLSIGPLTFFENWYDRVQPNAYWIARYLPDDLDADKKLDKARQVLSNAQEFLSLSAKKHVVTRTVMQYGTKRIAAILAVLLLVSLGIYAIADYYQKRNDVVIRAVERETIQLANRNNLAVQFIVPLITEQMISGNLTIARVIDGISDRNQQIKIANGLATQLIIQGRDEPFDEILESLSIADSLLAGINPEGQNAEGLSEGLEMIYIYSATAGHAYHINPDSRLLALVRSNAARSAAWALHILNSQPEGFSDVQHLNLALSNALNHNIFSDDDISRILKILSPYESDALSVWVAENYARDKVLVRGSQAIYGNRYNGLYQELANLYAALGNVDMALRSVDSLLRYQGAFYENDYTTHINNAGNIAAVFYTSGQEEAVDAFVAGYAARKNTNGIDFYNRLISRMLIDPDVIIHQNYLLGWDQMHSNLNLKYSDDAMVLFFLSKLEQEILRLSDPDVRNFQMAVAYKNVGILLAQRYEIRNGNMAESVATPFFESALTYYQQVSTAYLNQSISIIGLSGSDIISAPRKILFLHPDYRVPFHPFEPRSIIQGYNSALFVKYLIDQDLFDQIYAEPESLRYFELWFSDYHVAMSSRDWTQRDPIPFELLERIAATLEQRNAVQTIDLNLLYLHLAVHAFERYEVEEGIAYVKNIRTDRLLNSFQYANLFFMNSYSLELVASVLADLTVHDEFEQGYELVNVFRLAVNRSSLYGHASTIASNNGMPAEVANRLLDSARVEMIRLDNPSLPQPNRINVAVAMMFADPEAHADEAYAVIKNSEEKFWAINFFSYALAFHGNLYEARQQIPDMVSTGDRTFTLTYIASAQNQPANNPPEWRRFYNNEFLFIRRFLQYIREN